MFGYVTCDEGELLVKHQRLYSAAYCGLCHSIRASKMHVLLPFYQYDFTFLSLIRLLVTGERMELEKDFCLLHPFRRKKKRIRDNEAFRFTSFASLILTLEKVRDEILDADAPFFRRLLCRLCLPAFQRARSRAEKRDPGLSSLARRLEEMMAEGRVLEKRGAGLDDMCTHFARCLSTLFAFGTQGDAARLLSGMGDKLGRLIYTVDAIDDVQKDLKSGVFNPLIQNGRGPEKEDLVQLDMVLAFYIDEMKKILDLCDADPNLFAICENIICRGIPGKVQEIMKRTLGEENERSV